MVDKGDLREELPILLLGAAISFPGVRGGSGCREVSLDASGDGTDPRESIDSEFG